MKEWVVSEWEDLSCPVLIMFSFFHFFPLLSNPKLLLGILYLPCCAHTPIDSSIIVLHPACCPPSHWFTLPFPTMPFTFLACLPPTHPPPLTGLQPSYCWSYLTLPHSPLPSSLLFFLHFLLVITLSAWNISTHGSSFALQPVCYPSLCLFFFSLSLFCQYLMMVLHTTR